MANQDPPAVLTWIKHKTSSKFGSDAHNPGACSGHSLNIIGTNAYVFGGVCCDSEGVAKPSADLYTLKLGSAMEWSKVESKSHNLPLARWRHTANTINATQILVIGGFHNTDQRLNDVWVYDVVSCCWNQPNAEHNVEAVVPHLLSNSVWTHVMPARGSHSATVLGDSVYIFGGYGGSGYSRRDLDDLLALNYQTWTWYKLAPKGSPPEKRSGHSACAVEKKLYVYGGWNSSTQFQDMHVLDLEVDPPVWSRLNSTLPAPTWNLAGCSVMAIPTWKIFTFGGVTGTLSDGERQGIMTDSLAILETGNGRWMYPPVEGKGPTPRSDTAMAYDSKNSRLLVFGGWSDQWHDELYTLDVGDVVGPPYAITDIVPNMGPITGNTAITVFGIDFFNTPDVMVRFGSRRHYIDVQGVYVSQSKINCASPDFSKFPPGAVDVRVSLNGDSLTTTFQKFTFFSVTNASSSIMFGPGLLSGCATNEDVTFMIQSRDENGSNRTTGGDEYMVTILALGADEDGGDKPIPGAYVQDLENGKYVVTYVAPYACKYEVRVIFMGTFGGSAGPIRGSGTVIEFDEFAPRDNNIVTGPLVMRSLKEDVKHLNEITREIGDGIFVRVKDDAWTVEEQIRVLVAVKEKLLILEEKAFQTSLLVARSEATMDFLKEEEVKLDKLDEYLALGKAAWEKIMREGPQVQTRITPMMRSHMTKIRNDIQGYEGHVTAYMKGLGFAAFRQFATGVTRAKELLDAADVAYAKEKQTCQSMSHISEVFDCQKEMEGPQSVITEVGFLLQDFRALWECVWKSSSVIDNSKFIVWSELNPEEFEDSAKGIVQATRRLPKSVKLSDAFKGLDRLTKDFLSTCPLITSLRSPAMRERHWRELMDVVKKEFPLPASNPNMTIRDLLELELHKVANEVEEITDKAVKEARHEETLVNLEATWSQVQFVMNWYKDTDVPLLRMEEDSIEQLESDQMAVQSIVGSRYPYFKGKASEWQVALGAVSEVTQLLAEIQRTWSYLEPLFMGSEEVKKELPEDAKRFEGIDSQVKEILQKAWKIRNVKGVCVQHNLYRKLEDLQAKQEQCKKSLSEFLDGKRRQFPRFYFMSEADLLDLLSNSGQPMKVLQHIDKILLSTKELKCAAANAKADDGRLQATQFIAGVGKEVTKFNPPCRINGKAEQYLLSLLQAQVATLAKCLTASLTRYPRLQRTDWLMKKEEGEPVDPAQIILLVGLIEFVRQVEKSMVRVTKGEGDAVNAFLKTTKQQLAELITMTQKPLKPGDRQRLMCMITLDAHNRDIVETLIHEKALSSTDFQWQSKLRPTAISPSSGGDESGARFHICDASFEYGFEYLGNGPRLVVTPLTDRIYVTATQALHLKMGCAPAGPAGTGKTETTKDLASALGKCCYVFNCSPEMDYQSMGNIFKGLAASGSWGCFDEFNRLIPEVLSVCSVQFKAVCDSLKAYTHEEATHQVTIEGDTVGLDPTCGSFITMNPGYLGRSELPEGLKALFRPITVVVPDLVLICENMLMAEGFLGAKNLASKFYGLYSLLSELLSKQSHYDWGLRAVKSVLVVAGNLKRAEPNLEEDALLMRALRDFNIPKIVQADEIVFYGLLNDLFPGLAPLRVVDEDLAECVNVACEESGLWPDPFFCLKVMQLDELLDIRHCVFVMGPPGSGKSACWKMLQGARNLKYPEQKVKVVDINPKVVPTENLYGHINMVSREWKDGLLSSMMRDLGRIPNENPKWLIMDGDLDANWIESMNSVMDDNKMLTLASNERIPLKHYMRMIFEIRDLKYATPATVSRAGILYISMDDGSQWRSIIGSWVRSRPDDLFEDPDREKIHSLFEKFFPDCLRYFNVSLNSVVTCNDVSIAVSMLRLLDTLLTRPIVMDDMALEATFIFCLIWGFGSVLTISDDGTDNRKNFSEWFRGKFKLKAIPTRDMIFDYWLDFKTFKFEPWKSSPAFRTVEFDSTTMNMAEVTVPTAETASVSYWLDLLVANGSHTMLAGPAGTGKTQLVNGMLSELNPENHISTSVNMNYFTTAAVLLTSLEAPLQKRTGSVFGPPGAAKLVYFVDDLNLPEVDPYGTQSAIALLRQHIDYGHWYDVQKLSMKVVDDCMYVSAMNPTAGSFSVDPRLQRHFTTFAVGMPSSSSLMTIYQTFLDGHLNFGGFASDICSLSSNLIKATLNIHKDVSETFRKTAANFHYEFNIRHLANVFQGLLVATPTSIREAEKFVFLWLHESERVYGDRLVDAEDLTKFKDILQNQARKTFIQYNVSRFYASTGNTKVEPLVFCHFADGTTQGDDLSYDRSSNIDELRATLETALDDYNETHTTMKLVLFDDAVLHVARIIRIIKQTGGHALLVGVGGSGKQSLAKLASHICGYNLVSIVVSQTYSLLDFKTDLQNMYNKAAVKQEGVLFLLSDAQINNEKFFVYLNDLLSSGNIPDLYSRDEKDAIVNSLASKAKGAGFPPDPAGVWRYFLSKVRENLHVCLCFSPVGVELRTRARRFPALANCTVIDWFQPWPEQALMSVGKKVLSQMDMGSAEIMGAVEKFMPLSFIAVSKMCKTFALSEGKRVYTTPKSYLEALNLFQSLLARKRTDTDASIHRLANGVDKLVQAAADVVELEVKLKTMLGTAEEKRQVAEGIAENVKKEKEVVEAENAKAMVEADKVAVIQAEVAAQQADAQKDLAQAEPALLRAMAALDSLDRRDLGNCKTMAKPPPGVDDVFGAVMVLLAGINPNIIVQKSGRVREKERTWDAAKKALLGNVNGFLDELKAFKINIDEGSVAEVNWKEVRPFLALEHFQPDIIEKRNSAAAGLCSWVINIVNYFDIVQLVEPKRIALRAANEQLDAANEQLQAVQAIVADLQEKLDALTVEFNAAEASRLEAQMIADKGKMKLDLANRLTKALGSEELRWKDGIERMTLERELLVGDCLIASAFVSYVGPFTKQYREVLLTKDILPLVTKAEPGCPPTIPYTEGADPIAVLCTDAEIAEYQTQGLPADKVSSENAAIVLNSVRYPLMIDPQLQAIYWIKKRVVSMGMTLSVSRLGNPNLIKLLLKSMEAGDIFLIENMGEYIEPSLMAIINRTTIKRGGKNFVVIGDQEVELHNNFRLYLHTKLSNPHYPPEIQAETTLVNFSVTQDGLEEQLLSLVVGHERPDLAAQRSALILQQNLFTIKVKQLEDNILIRLAEAQGDITEDQALIEELELSKKISDEIATKLVESQKTSEKIDATSEQYRPVAKRGSLLFFVMNGLDKVHSYYMFSLNSFVLFFLRGISTAGGVNERESDDFHSDVLHEAPDQVTDLGALAQQIERRVHEIEENDKLANDANMPERLLILKDSVSRVVFDFVRTGLFERDKLTVAAQICLRILVEEGELEKMYVDAMIRCRVAEDVPPRGDELSQWLSEISWCRLKALEEDLAGQNPVYDNILERITGDGEEWEEWYNQTEPESASMPGDWNSLPSFQKLMLLRVFRPDRLPMAMGGFVSEVLGSDFVVQPPFNMATTYKYTTAHTPVLFVLYPGVDPTTWVEELGKKYGMTTESGMLANISMGQGQEQRADETLQELSKVGGWVFLQNVHLMQTWITTLEEKLETLTPHHGFRVFITAEPPALASMKNLPEGLLQSCICVANEPPSDLQANLARAWDMFSQDRLEECTKLEEFKACLFGLCFFHSLMLGRRRFGFQGWSRAYGFNNGDLKICADVLQSNLNREIPNVPWKDLIYMFGEIMYGGHITDFFDRRTDNTYLQVIFTDSILSGGELAPKLKSPDCKTWEYENYVHFIKNNLPQENPVMYGLHANAEIGFLTSKTENLCQTILRLEMGSEDGAAGSSNSALIRETMVDLMSRRPSLFVMIELSERVKTVVNESELPYAVVVMQECARMNALMEEMEFTLDELQKGLNGQLNMSQGMDDMMESLAMNMVPGRNPFHACSWERLAWASRKPLSSWFSDLLQRRAQLESWTKNFDLPYSVWLPGMVNPTALLTAIKQVTARKHKLPLDQMSLDTHVTRTYRYTEALALGVYPEDGIFVHGLQIEGARWTDEEESADDVQNISGTACAGHLIESRLKQLLTPMPVLYVRAVPVRPHWSPVAVGYLRADPDLYECPVYYTAARGGTFVFLATLRTIDSVNKWILAGVALLMQSDD